MRAEAADDAPPLSLVHRDLSARRTTTAAATFALEPWVYPLASGPRQRSGELRHVLQEVVDRPGFAPGNALLLLVTGRGDRRAFALKPLSGREVRLVVEYDAGD